jgi:hypothetical protein
MGSNQHNRNFVAPTAQARYVTVTKHRSGRSQSRTRWSSSPRVKNARKRSTRLIDHLVAKNAEPLQLDLDHIAILHPERRLAKGPHTR